MKYSRLVHELRHLRWYERTWEIAPLHGDIGVLARLVPLLPEREGIAVRLTIIDRDKYEDTPGGGVGAACEVLCCEVAEVYRIRQRALRRLEGVLQAMRAPERRSPPEGGRGEGDPAEADSIPPRT